MTGTLKKFSPDEWIRFGESYIVSGMYEEAIECFDKAIETDPSNLVAWMTRGYAFTELERYNEAVKCFDKLIHICEFMDHSKGNDQKIRNFFIDILYKKGLSLSNLDLHKEAIECFDKVVKIDPDYSDAWHNKGVALGNLQRYREAIECFDKAIEIEPEYADSLRNKGFVYSKLGEYDKAMECINRAIGIKPYFSYAWNTKGYALLSHKEEYEEAIECFDKAIETDPNFSHAWYNKGYALISKKNYECALECINKAIDIDPTNAIAWNYRGYAHLSLKMYEKAKSDFDKAIETDPRNNADAWHYKGIAILYSTQTNEETINCFDKAIEIFYKLINTNSYDPNSTNLAYSWYYKGYALNSLSKYDEAVKCFNKAIEINANFADAWHYKGVALGNLEMYDNATECFKNAIKILAENLASKEKPDVQKEMQRSLADIWRKKGFALGRMGENDEAMKSFDKAIEIYAGLKDYDKDIDIDFAYAWNSRGYFFLYHLKRYEETIRCFDNAIAIKKDFALPHYNKGFVFCKLGEYDKALVCLNKAISLDPNLPYAWYNKGYALSSIGKYSEAIDCFDKAIEIFYKLINTNSYDPNSTNLAYSWNNKGYALSYLERYKEAIECFDKAIEIYDQFSETFTKNTELDFDLAYAWYNKGYALSSIGKYSEAIDCFDKAIKEKGSDLDIAYLRRGQSKYMLDDYYGAIADFRIINEKSGNLVGEKHNNIGLCYYKEGSIKKAEQQYILATGSNLKSTRATAYYNLGVLYNYEGNHGKARAMFKNCLKIDPTFSKATEASNKLEVSDRTEWYNWWFGHGKGKKVIGILLIASVLTPLLIIASIIHYVYFVSHDFNDLISFIKTNVSVLITGILTIIGLYIVVLLLPNLTKIKVGSMIELEMIPSISSDIRLETFTSMPSLVFVSMPTEIPLQTFRMPIQSLRMPMKYPLKSIRMALQSLHHHR